MADKRSTIPAKIKRQVLIEAGHRCAIQTCRNSANVDLHHIIPWEKIREHSPENLIALCPNCHRLVHDGTIDKKSLEKYKKNCKDLFSPPIPHVSNSIKAYIKFNPNTATGILDADNISAFVDEGPLTFSFFFIDSFEDETFVVNAIGDGSVIFRVVRKNIEFIQIAFYPPCPNLVRLEFRF